MLGLIQSSGSVAAAGKNAADHGFRYYLFDYVLFKVGGTDITLFTIIGFFLGFFLFIVFAGWLKRVLVRKVFVKTHFAAGTSQFIGSLVQYTIIVLGFLFCLQIVGIELTSLSVLFGAVGVGVGFGLQNVASNFISGIIIAFEQPFKVGDRIELDSIQGKVIEIGGRSTRLLNDDETINIIPNQMLISEPVRNFRRFSDHIPHEIKIQVAYGTDAEVVLNILKRAADGNPQVLPQPEPKARLKNFNKDSLDFVLNVWRSREAGELDKFLSDLNVRIYEELLKSKVSAENEN